MNKTKDWIAWLGFFCILSTYQNLSAQPKMSEADKEKNKLVQRLWRVEHIVKDGRVIDIQSIAGETTMKFYTFKKKNKKTKKKRIAYKFKMDMGGGDRIFDYTIQGDSIKFLKVNGWNDFRIIKLNKKTFELDHLSADGDLIRWVMVATRKNLGQFFTKKS